ncbi:GGDEF domain-containing protein [Lysinibacillus sp. LZ02]|uniref:GGDEF domain-containing protein n=1 Tax=Lysinibacillus sp. LZ02 TaxID=3420668 RepID=UPI003D35EE2A
MVSDSQSFYIHKAKIQHNFRKIALVSKVMTGIVLFILLVETVIFIFTKEQASSEILTNVWGYLLLLAFNLICHYYIQVKRVNVTEENYRKMDLYIMLYIGTLTSLGVMIALTSQPDNNQLMMYTLIMLICCSYFVLTNKQILPPIVITSFVLVTGLYVMQGNSPQFYGQLLYLAILFPITYLLSRAFYFSFHHMNKMQARLKSEIDMTRKLSQELSEANQKLAIQASLDPLTNLYNRRAINEYMEQLEAQMLDNPYLLSAIVLDIDYFKLYNDTYGHTSGDEVLRKIGRVLKGVATKYNVFAARWGGEEFTLLIVEQQEDKIREICEEMIREVHLLQIEHKASKVDRVITVSIGAHTQIVATANDILLCIEQADMALYSVKEKGRNAFEHKMYM